MLITTFICKRPKSMLLGHDIWEKMTNEQIKISEIWIRQVHQQDSNSMHSSFNANSTEKDPNLWDVFPHQNSPTHDSPVCLFVLIVAVMWVSLFVPSRTTMSSITMSVLSVQPSGYQSNIYGTNKNFLASNPQKIYMAHGFP